MKTTSTYWYEQSTTETSIELVVDKKLDGTHCTIKGLNVDHTQHRGMISLLVPPFVHLNNMRRTFHHLVKGPLN